MSPCGSLYTGNVSLNLETCCEKISNYLYNPIHVYVHLFATVRANASSKVYITLVVGIRSIELVIARQLLNLGLSNNFLVVHIN